MSRCPKCETKSDRPAPHAETTKEYFDILIKPLRYVAYRHGYALAVHGSLGYDIDLIACPWRASATSAEHVAEAIRSTAEKIVGYCKPRQYDVQPERKPCGRLAWSFYLELEIPDRTRPYIDLSVMPAVDDKKELAEGYKANTAIASKKRK